MDMTAMSNPDNAEQRALQAAQNIATESGRLWIAAFADGAREGIHAAAACIESTINQVRDDYSIDTDVRRITIAVCEHLRDQFRLTALSITDPVLPTPPWQVTDG